MYARPGARIKIGYKAALVLLRCGALVIATTRFPKDAAQRFAQEKDFAEWKDRLHIYGLDMRQLPAVERFCEHLLATYPHLDMIMYAHHHLPPSNNNDDN